MMLQGKAALARAMVTVNNLLGEPVRSFMMLKCLARMSMIFLKIHQ